MDTGTRISVAGHAGLILWAMLGGLFNAPAPRPALVASDVSLVSAEEFAALQPPGDAAPQVSQTAPRRPEAVAPETAPEPAASQDRAVRRPTPEAEPQASPDAAPATPQVEPVPLPDVAPAPREVAPPSSPDSATLLPGSALRPREAPRVAPEPAPAPAPDAEVADTVRESVTPDSTAPAETPSAPQEAAAPEAASTRIITEATETDEDTAEPPAPAAPEASRRPQSRPARPVRTATPEPARPQPEPAPEAPAPSPAPRDPIAEALAEAQTSPTAPSAPARGLSPGARLSGAETDGLRRAISSCWNLGASSSEAMRTTVVVGVTMKRDGTAEAVRLISSDAASDSATAVAFDAARRAILRCVANADLPAAKYDSWSEIEMVFNPDGMRLR